jgi:hypothetical protein
MLLTVPILFPVITKLGIDPVHFGVVVTLNLMIGCLTPAGGPQPVPRFRDQRRAGDAGGARVDRIHRRVADRAGLITYIPQLVLWLPT